MWKRKKWLWLLPVLVLVGYIAGNVISICRFSGENQTRPCDVAIVLGAAVSETEVSEVYKQRLNHAVSLYEQELIAAVIVTGGVTPGHRQSDAQIAKGYLLRQGIPEAAVLVEETSTITQENLENAKILMDNQGYQTALIVSDPLHMKRAMLLCRDAGIDGYSSPTTTSAYKTWKTQIPFTARETFFYIGYKWYRLLPKSFTSFL